MIIKYRDQVYPIESIKKRNSLSMYFISLYTGMSKYNGFYKVETKFSDRLLILKSIKIKVKRGF